MHNYTWFNEFIAIIFADSALHQRLGSQICALTAVHTGSSIATNCLVSRRKLPPPFGQGLDDPEESAKLAASCSHVNQ
jgi:hypothetical protein